MTICWRVATLISLGGLLSLLGFSQDVNLEVQPSSIVASSSNFTVEARVTLKNQGAEALRQVSLSQFSNDGMKAEVGKPTSTVAASKHAVMWPVKISGLGQTHLPGSIIFDAHYVTSSGAQHVYAPLSFQTESASKPVEATLEGSLESISEQRPGSMYLLVTNNIDAPVQVSVSAQVPLTAIAVSAVSPFHVPPHSTAATKIDILAASRVTPGLYPIMIEVTTRWKWADRIEERHFVLSKSATIGVFFESELLKALSIPTFLVLPGCLMVFTFQFLLSFNLLRLKDHSTMPDMAVTSPGFWILSVSLSGLFAYLYCRWTGINYLLSYGVGDLINVWVSSIPIGFVIYLGVASLSLSWRRAHVPSSSDKPVDILKKLANNHRGILLSKVSYTLNNQTLGGFLVENIEDGQALAWVAPGITADWQTSVQAAALKMEFDSVIDGDRDPAKLAEILERAGNLVTVDWDTTGVVPNPYHAKVEAITQYLPADLIVG